MSSLRKTILAIIVASFLAPLAPAQQVCPCIPQTKLWTSTVCESWDCASALLTDGKGDPAVFAIPIAMQDHRWLMIRQVAAGAYTDDSPYAVETFDRIAEASARLASIDSDRWPKILSSPDGKLLVIFLRHPETRRRSVGR